MSNQTAATQVPSSIQSFPQPPVEGASDHSRLRRGSSDLPEEAIIRVEVNGCLVGAISCVPDAPRELAVGWAFSHRFFNEGRELGRVCNHGDRISIMVDGGCDLDRLSSVATGWSAPERDELDAEAERKIRLDEGNVLIEADVLMLSDRALAMFDRDGGTDGFIHAALASPSGVLCVARDCAPMPAIQKVLGWALLEDVPLGGHLLVVHGIVQELAVCAASRAGIAAIVMDGIPTAFAQKQAANRGLSLLASARSYERRWVVDAGNVRSDIDEPVA